MSREGERLVGIVIRFLDARTEETWQADRLVTQRPTLLRQGENHLTAVFAPTLALDQASLFEALEERRQGVRAEV